MPNKADLLALLWQQSLLLVLALAALALLRPLLRRSGGAGAVLAAWWGLPAVLVSPWLPAWRPSQQPAAWQVQTESVLTEPLRALPSAAPGFDLAGLLLTLWLAGLVLLALGLAVQQHRYLRQGPRLPSGASPAWVGLLRGRLWLPRDYRQRFSTEERRLIRAHERAHARRGDNLWTLLATVIWLLHWFNPLAWWALRRLRADQELAADAQVLRQHPGERSTYLRALAKAEGAAPTALAISPFAPHPLIERIRRMKSHTAARVARPWIAGITGLWMLGTAWALNPTQTPEPTPATKNSSAPFVVTVHIGERLVDQQRVQLGADGAGQVRLGSFNDKDMLITLQAKPLAKGAEEIRALVNVGFPANSSTELRSDLAPGEPVLVTVLDPDRKQGSAIVRIARELPLDERWPLDPNQTGQVALDIQAFVDGKVVDGQQSQAAFGQQTPLALGTSGPLPIKGWVKATARLAGALDLHFELNVAGRKVTPRVVTQDGVKATIESNSSEEPRLIRLEITPRRIQP